MDPGRAHLQWRRDSPWHLHPQVTESFMDWATKLKLSHLDLNWPRWLRLKTYHWRGLYEIPTYRSLFIFGNSVKSKSSPSLIFFRGKIKRFFGQFSPHGWIEFQWNPLSSFERYFASEFIWHFNTYFVFDIFDPTLCIFQVVCHHLPGHRIPHH